MGILRVASAMYRLAHVQTLKLSVTVVVGIPAKGQELTKVGFIRAEPPF